MPDHEITVDDKVFGALRGVQLARPWVAIATLVERMRGEDGGYVMSTMAQAVVWEAREGRVARADVTLPRVPLLDLYDYFEDEFDLDDWTRVTLVATVDGASSARGVVDPAGPAVAGYVGFDTDPFWNYVEEHRAELEALARRYYGTGR